MVACEESQAVCKEFRKLGHEAYSCDIVECSGGHPEWHIQVDALQLLKMEWDLVIAFPPCTHLAVSGAKYFEEKRNDGRQKDAIEFFCEFLNCSCRRVAIENPVGIISGDYVSKWFPEIAQKNGLPRKYAQIIQPWQYGHPESKKTCLWLKNLPNLVPTDICAKPADGVWQNQTKDHQNKLIVDGKWIGYNDPRTAKERSKTYPGVARAIATQWSEYILAEEGQMDIYDFISQ